MRDAFHVHRQAADKIACGISLFFVALRHQHHDGNRFQTRPPSEAGQSLGGGHLNHDPLLFATVTFLGDHQPFGTAVGEFGLQVLIDVRDDRLIKTLWVPFESQDKVGLARHDVLGDGRLSPHRVDRDDRSFDLDQLQ